MIFEEEMSRAILADAFVVKDSGKRQEFSGGMVRDTAEGKIDFELILNGPMAWRWAEHLTKGAVKYPDPTPGVPNWTLAEGQAELVRARKSLARHFAQYMRGDQDEDHAAAIFFNLNLAEYIKAKMPKEPTQKVSGNQSAKATLKMGGQERYSGSAIYYDR